MIQLFRIYNFLLQLVEQITELNECVYYIFVDQIPDVHREDLCQHYVEIM